MFNECKKERHPNGTMVQTIPKLIPYTAKEAACPRRKSKIGIPPGHRVCRFPYCDKNLCANGWCEETMKGFKCHCSPGFRGSLCSKETTTSSDAKTMSTTETAMTTTSSTSSTDPSMTDEDTVTISDAATMSTTETVMPATSSTSTTDPSMTDEDIFTCTDGSAVLNRASVCDYTPHCTDGSDESTCNFTLRIGMDITLSSHNYPGYYPDGAYVLWLFQYEKGTDTTDIIYIISFNGYVGIANHGYLKIGYGSDPDNSSSVEAFYIGHNYGIPRDIYLNAGDIFVEFDADSYARWSRFQLQLSVRNVSASMLSIRLSGGHSGRLEVLFDGAWGSVCDDSFDDNDGAVVCRQLGLLGYQSFFTQGEGIGEIVIDDLACRGNETNIAQCGHNGHSSHNCGHKDDVGVTCQATQVRIASGSNSGRAEIYYQGEWGTICDDFFDNNDATVLCRMLGYNSGTYTCCAILGAGSGIIVLDDLWCSGSETDILLCPHGGLAVHDCGHYEDVGITCA